MGVNMADIGETLQTYLGSVYVNDFNLFGRTWQVYAQAEPQFRINPTASASSRPATARAKWSPSARWPKCRRSAAWISLQRYNLFYSADVSKYSTIPASVPADD